MKKNKGETHKAKSHEWLAIYISIAAFTISLIGLYFQYFYSDYTVIAKVNSFDRLDFQISSFSSSDYGYDHSIKSKLNLSLVNTGTANQYLTDILVTCESKNKKGVKLTLEYYYSPELYENVYELEPSTRVVKSFEVVPGLINQVDGDVISEIYMSLFEELNGPLFDYIVSALAESDGNLSGENYANKLPKCDLNVQLGFLGVDGNIYYKTMPSSMKNVDTVFSADFLEDYTDEIDLYAENNSDPVKFDVTDSKDGDEILPFVGYDHVISDETHYVDADTNECTFVTNSDDYWYNINLMQSEYMSIRLTGTFNNCMQLGMKYFSLLEGIDNSRFYGVKVRLLPDNKWVATHELDSQWTNIQNNASGKVNFTLVGIPASKQKKIELKEIWCLGAELQGQCEPAIDIEFWQYLTTLKLPKQ